MKKIIFLLILIFCLSGCSIDYNLTIDSNQSIDEKFIINAEVNSEYSKEYLYSEYAAEYPIFEDEEFLYNEPTNKVEGYTYYDKTFEELTNGYKFNYKANYNFNNLANARSIKTAFNNVRIGYLTSEGYYYLSASNTNLFNLYENLENININITIPNFEVIENNATKTNNDTYTWVINKDSNTNINLKFKRKDNTTIPTKPDNENNPDNNPEKPREEPKENNVLDYIVIGGVLIIFVVGIIGLIKYKSLKS